MKITKETLKQLIKEELELISSGLDGPEDDEGDARDDRGADMGDAERFIRGESYTTSKTNFGKGHGPDGIWQNLHFLENSRRAQTKKIKKLELKVKQLIDHAGLSGKDRK